MHAVLHCGPLIRYSLCTDVSPSFPLETNARGGLQPSTCMTSPCWPPKGTRGPADPAQWLQGGSRAQQLLLPGLPLALQTWARAADWCLQHQKPPWDQIYLPPPADAAVINRNSRGTLGQLLQRLRLWLELISPTCLSPQLLSWQVLPDTKPPQPRIPCKLSVWGCRGHSGRCCNFSAKKLSPHIAELSQCLCSEDTGDKKPFS